MKKIILSLFVSGFTLLATGQVAVTGISPASIEGNYTFEIGENTQGWNPALDFSIPGTYVQDTLVLVEDGTPGTNPQGNPISQEGCEPLINGADVNGKIAVIYRNTCEFGAKALHAQNAGAVAVIILNRDPEVIGMNGGVNGTSVTIPVVMLSSIDGQLLTDEMANGPVVMFIGNKAGLHANDLALDERLLLVPQYHGVHTLLAQDGNDFSMDLGLRVYNYGSDSQTDATANATVTGPSGVVYDETITFSLDGVSGTLIDSLDIFPGEANSFPPFSLASYPVGEYTLSYTISLDGGTDDFPNDNTYSVTFVINDTYISRARLDPTTFKPIAQSQVSAADPAAPAQPYTELRYCMSFKDENASRLAAIGLHTVVSVDTTLASSLLGKQIFLEVFQWDDPVNTITGTGGYDQLGSVVNIAYSFNNEVEIEEVYFEFDDPLYLIDNQAYLFCVIDYEEKLRLGYDRSVDFNATLQHYGMLPNPLFASPNANPSPWFGGGFGPDLTPAFGIHAIDAAVASIDGLVSLEGRAYPNPTNDVVQMIIPMDGKAVISVTDLAGRTVASHDVTFLNNQANINMEKLQSGMYVINVAYENGSKSTFNVVKK